MKNGIVVLKGIIELQTPMLIGSGNDENSNIDVLVDCEGKPFIPATSFVGVLKEHLKQNYTIDEKDSEHFWGYSENQKTAQSILKCSDLLLKNEHEITVRDGVKINRKNGIAKPGGKFDFEVVERGAQFELKLEARYDESNEDFVKKMFISIKFELENLNVRVGAKTLSGLGKIKLKDANLFEYDFSNKEHVLKYLEKEDGNKLNNLTDRLAPKCKEFIIDAWFDLKTSLISRSYSTDPSVSDATHIQSKGEYILPGTGLKGAISSRAEKILRTKFGNDKAKKLYNELFGFVKKKEESKDENDKEAQRSRVIIEEYILPAEKFSAEQQTRIKIDRFTGGSTQTALFDSMPLFRKDKTNPEKVINIKMSIKDFKKYEAGLMLLVLKDLWTADLPIGGEKNIGRGVLEGVYAKISNGNGESIEITDPNKLTQDEKNTLQSLVDALNNCEVHNEKQ